MFIKNLSFQSLALIFVFNYPLLIAYLSEEEEAI